MDNAHGASPPTKPPNEHHGTQSALRMEIIIVRSAYTISRTSRTGNPHVLFFLKFTFVDFRALNSVVIRLNVYADKDSNQLIRVNYLISIKIVLNLRK